MVLKAEKKSLKKRKLRSPGPMIFTQHSNRCARWKILSFEIRPVFQRPAVGFNTRPSHPASVARTSLTVPDYKLVRI